jgi:hypothetical protein
MQERFRLCRIMQGKLSVSMAAGERERQQATCGGDIIYVLDISKTHPKLCAAQFGEGHLETNRVRKMVERGKRWK